MIEKLTITKNTFWLVISEAVSRLTKLLLLIYAARVLGATNFGKFSFALAVVSILVIVADLGLSSITTRDLSRDESKEKEFSNIFSLKIVLSIVTFGVMMFSAYFVTNDYEVQHLILILSGFILFNSLMEILFAFLRARQNMKYESLTKVIQSILVAGLSWLLISRLATTESLAYGYFISGILSFTFIFILFWFKICAVKLKWAINEWIQILKISWPLGIVAISVGVYNYIDSVMLGYWGYITENGWYNAAYRIIGATTIPMLLVSQSYYPVLSRALSDTWTDVQKIWNNYFNISVLIAIPIIVGGITLANEIVIFLYGQAFVPAAVAFQILIVAAGAMMIMGTVSHILIIANQQYKNFWVAFSGALLNIILNVLLIPSNNFYGAATATVITVVFMTFLYIILVYKYTGVRVFNHYTIMAFIISSISSLLMFFFITVFKTWHIHLLVNLTLSSLVYIFFSFLIHRVLNRKIIHG